jgi:hypothetical protein
MGPQRADDDLLVRVNLQFIEGDVDRWRTDVLSARAAIVSLPRDAKSLELRLPPLLEPTHPSPF